MLIASALMDRAATTGWLPATVVVLAATLVADALLAKRYAAGGGGRDQKTARHLILSFGSNVVVMLVAGAFGICPFSAPIRALAPLGFAVLVAGVVLRYAAIASLGERFTWRVAILPGHALQTSGVYRLVRHPSYTGGLVALYGGALALGSWLPFVLLTAVHLPIVLRRIAVEESALAAHFGDDWIRYAGRTSRLLPFVW